MTLTVDELDRLRDGLRLRAWPEVTTDDLARAAGVSRMTLHRRGVSKQDVLDRLGDALAAEHREALLPALAHPGTGRERLELALNAMLAVDERYLALLDALADQTGAVFHERGDGAVLTQPRFTDALRRILEDGVRDGTLRADDPVEAATLLFNAAGWTYRHMRTGHRWPAERARTRVVALLIDGVRA
jgi:AcrR family transcriptional regulator